MNEFNEWVQLNPQIAMALAALGTLALRDGKKVIWWLAKVAVSFLRAKAEKTPDTADDAALKKADALLGDEPPKGK